MEYEEVKPFVEYIEEMLKKAGSRYSFVIKDTSQRLKRETDYETYRYFVMLLDMTLKESGGMERKVLNIPVEVGILTRHETHYMDLLQIGGTTTFLPGTTPPNLKLYRSIHELMDIDPFLLKNAIAQKKLEHQQEMSGLTSDIPTYNSALAPDYNQLLRQQREIDMVSDKNILQFQKRKELY